MSRITKTITICDNCSKEINYENWYYTADITNQSNSCDYREQIMKGDFCQKCFKELIKKESVLRRTSNE